MSSHGITLADVAAEAGVHSSTVSRVLSRPDLIGAPTRTAVLEAVERLGYIPNRAARQLAGGRVGSLGVLVPDITNPFFAQVVRAVQQCCRAADLTMLLADTDQRAEEELAEARALTGNVDGFVVCSPVAGAKEWRQAVGATPIVFVNRRARGVPSVAFDQRSIVELGIAHLRELGHRRIGVVRGPDAYWSARERTRAIRGLDGIDGLDGFVLFGPERPDFESGRALADEIVASGVSGVLAFNDLQALGIIAGCREAGKSVPQDLSVVGSDDIAAGTMSDPALTTITAPVRDLASAVLHLIEALIEAPADTRDSATSTATEVALPVTLTVRASTMFPGHAAPVPSVPSVLRTTSRRSSP